MLPEDARRRMASDEMMELCDGGTLHGYSFQGTVGRIVFGDALDRPWPEVMRGLASLVDRPACRYEPDADGPRAVPYVCSACGCRRSEPPKYCPECGRVAQQLNRKSGMCAPCTEAMHVDEELVFNELLMAECRQTDDNCEEVQRLRREYARLRQANSRLCRKYRLQGKRGRK